MNYREKIGGKMAELKKQEVKTLRKKLDDGAISFQEYNREVKNLDNLIETKPYTSFEPHEFSFYRVRGQKNDKIVYTGIWEDKIRAFRECGRLQDCDKTFFRSEMSVFTLSILF